MSTLWSSSQAGFQAGVTSPITRSRCRAGKNHRLSFAMLVALFGTLLSLSTIPSSVHTMTLSDEPGQNREEVATNIPEFVSKSAEMVARENSTIVLECDVKDLGEFVVMWKFHKDNKQQVLFADKIAIQARRYPAISMSNSTNSNGIIIKHLTSDLVGEYICEISTNTPKYIKYNVSMMTAPIIVPTPSNGKTTVRKNSRLSLACDVRPSPSPATIQWFHNDKLIEDNSSTLEIASVQSLHEGSYICAARNEIGERRFSFNVEVQYEPEITISERIIHGPIGDNVEVRCDVKANPQAMITWQFSNNSIVRNSHKHNIENSAKYSVLRIRNVDLKDYDNYYCQAKNEIGTETVFFEVTGKPSKPKFTSPSIGNDGESYLIDWTVFSQNPIKSYDLRIREVDHATNRRSEWRHIPVAPVNKDDGPVRKQSYRVDNLSQFNGYEIDLEVENEFGKTRSDIFSFVATESNSSNSIAGFHFLSICFALLSLSLGRLLH